MGWEGEREEREKEEVREGRRELEGGNGENRRYMLMDKEGNFKEDGNETGGICLAEKKEPTSQV